MPEYAGILVTNFHPEAPHAGSLDSQSEEDRVSRLARLLQSSASGWRVVRVGAHSATSRLAVQSHVKQEVARALSQVPPGAIHLFLATGSGAYSEAGEPALLARDVSVDFTEDGLIPLDWFASQYARARPGHAVLILDLSFVDGAFPPPEDVLKKINYAGYNGTTIAVVRRNGQRPISGALLGAMEAGAVNLKTGAVSVAGLVTFLQRLLGSQDDCRLAFCSSLATGEDVDLLASPPISMALGEPFSMASVDIEPDQQGMPVAPGTTLPGRVKVLEQIGAGGFGTVFRAQQVELNREVAVKVLRQGALVDEDSVRLFQREMKAVAHLKHPNIVTIHQSGKLPDGRLFYVMELLGGETLRSRLLRLQRLRLEQALQLTHQLLDGLAHAHKRGVIHRDVKPENIMLVPRPGDKERLVILDFGIARWKEGHAVSPSSDPHSVSSSGLRVGTPGYMAPEQLEGNRVTETADVYSAAVLLCEMLTGTRPGEMSAVSHLSGMLMHNAVPAAVRGALGRGLQTDPTARFATVSAFKSYLQGDLATAEEGVKTSQVRPFMLLSPFTEDDNGLFFGRDDELCRLLDRTMGARVILLTGVSGVGKSSLLRAGVVPASLAIGQKALYLACRTDPVKQAMDAFGAEGSLRELCREAAGDRHKVLLVLDQLEAVYAPGAVGKAVLARFEQQLTQLVADKEIQVTVILAARDDFLGYMAPLRRRLGLSAYDEFRLELLAAGQARQAMEQPFAMARIHVDGELLAALHTDLVRAARQLGMAPYGEDDRVYPPHLQLACGLLFDALGPGESRLTLNHYRKIGRLQGVLEGHLEQVLRADFNPADSQVARLLLKELVTGARTRALLPESQLCTMGPEGVPGEATQRAIRGLARARLIQPQWVDGRQCWELVHDCLIDQVLTWARQGDREIKKARDLIRFHLLQSTSQKPLLLPSTVLEQVCRYPQAVDEVAREMVALPPESRPAVTAAQLFQLSKRRRTWRRLLTRSGGLLLLGALVVFGGVWLSDLSLQAENVGRFYLAIQAFDPDGSGGFQSVSAQQLPDLKWRLHSPGSAHGGPVGPPLDTDLLNSQKVELSQQAAGYRVTAPGGPAILVVEGRHKKGSQPCGPSIVQIGPLPGYAKRGKTDSPDQAIVIQVPSCAATRAGLMDVPAGQAYLGARNPAFRNPIRVATVPRFSIDKTEANVAGFARFNQAVTQIGHSRPVLPSGQDAQLPAVGMDWYAARAYCLWMGKDLPTGKQWVKAGRGGIFLDGDQEGLQRNPAPERTFAWGDGAIAGAQDPAQGLVHVGCCPDSGSPMGVLHLTSNALEWSRDVADVGKVAAPQIPVAVEGGQARAVRGGWCPTTSQDAASLAAICPMMATTRWHTVGFRCALVPD